MNSSGNNSANNTGAGSSSPPVQHAAKSVRTLPLLVPLSAPELEMKDWDAWDSWNKGWLNDLVYGKQHFTQSSSLAATNQTKGAPPPTTSPSSQQRYLHPHSQELEDEILREVEAILEATTPTSGLFGPSGGRPRRHKKKKSKKNRGRSSSRSPPPKRVSSAPIQSSGTTESPPSSPNASKSKPSNPNEKPPFTVAVHPSRIQPPPLRVKSAPPKKVSKTSEHLLKPIVHKEDPPIKRIGEAKPLNKEDYKQLMERIYDRALDKLKARGTKLAQISEKEHADKIAHGEIKVLTSKQKKEVVERLWSHIERKKKQREHMEAKNLAELQKTQKKLPQAEVESFISRNYEEQRTRKLVESQKLFNKYVKDATSVKPAGKLQATQQDELQTRLYGSLRQQEEKRKQKLAQYLAPLVESPQKSKIELEASCFKLSQGKSSQAS